MSEADVQIWPILLGAALAIAGGVAQSAILAWIRKRRLITSLRSEVEVSAELLAVDLNFDAFETVFGEHLASQRLLVKRVRDSRQIFDACANEVVSLPQHQSIIRHYGRLKAICDAMLNALDEDDQVKFEDLRKEILLSAECLKEDLS